MKAPERPCSEGLLNLYSAANGLDGAGKLNQEAIASGLDDPSVVVIDLRLDHLPAQVLDPGEGSFVVLPHEGGEADHVSREDRRKAPLGLRIRGNRHPVLPCRCRGTIVLRQSAPSRGIWGISRRLRDGEIAVRHLESLRLTRHLLTRTLADIPIGGQEYRQIDRLVQKIDGLAKVLIGTRPNTSAQTVPPGVTDACRRDDRSGRGLAAREAWRIPSGFKVVKA